MHKQTSLAIKPTRKNKAGQRVTMRHGLCRNGDAQTCDNL